MIPQLPRIQRVPFVPSKAGVSDRSAGAVPTDGCPENITLKQHGRAKGMTSIELPRRRMVLI